MLHSCALQLEPRYKLDGIITVVDAKHILEHLNEEKPEGVENESVEQVAFADRIILNKTDLVSETELEEVSRGSLLGKSVREGLDQLAPL